MTAWSSSQQFCFCTVDAVFRLRLVIRGGCLLYKSCQCIMPSCGDLGFRFFLLRACRSKISSWSLILPLKAVDKLMAKLRLSLGNCCCVNSCGFFFKSGHGPKNRDSSTQLHKTVNNNVITYPSSDFQNDVSQFYRSTGLEPVAREVSDTARFSLSILAWRQ